MVQLLGRTSGFAVAPTHRPCTKGLWMWSQPVQRTAADGSVYHLVLLDSEGIDAYDQTGTYSVQIFSLAVLLSSMFVYNQVSHAPPTQPAPLGTRLGGRRGDSRLVISHRSVQSLQLSDVHCACLRSTTRGAAQSPMYEKVKAKASATLFPLIWVPPVSG